MINIKLLYVSLMIFQNKNKKLIKFEYNFHKSDKFI